VHAPPKFGFYLIQLHLQALANRLPQDCESSVAPFLSANVRKAEEVERFWSPLSPLFSGLVCKWSERQQARLLRVELEAELSHSFC
jgi:hypothetical protein